MQRVCFVFEVFEGKEAEYKKRHDEIWPELVKAIKDSGFSNYSLFRRGVQIVAYFEVEPDAKWPLLTLARLSEARAWLERERAGGGGGATEDGGGDGGESGQNKGASSRKPPAAAVAIFEQLAELDPLRRNFYRDAAEGRAFFV